MLVIERNREPQFRSEELKKTLIAKCQATMAGMTKRVPALRARPFDIGHLSIACGIAYADSAPRTGLAQARTGTGALVRRGRRTPSLKITKFVDEDSGPKN